MAVFLTQMEKDYIMEVENDIQTDLSNTPDMKRAFKEAVRLADES